MNRNITQIKLFTNGKCHTITRKISLKGSYSNVLYKVTPRYRIQQIRVAYLSQWSLYQLLMKMNEKSNMQEMKSSMYAYIPLTMYTGPEG